MPSVRNRNRWQLALLVGVGGVVLSSACGSGSNPAALGGNSGVDSGYGGGSCDTPHPGCPCSSKGQSVACGEVVTQDPDGVTCAEGKAVCDGSQWGPCQISSTVFKSLHPIGLSAGSSGTLHPLDLQSDAADDAGNCDPCDPTCQGFVDNSNGVDGGAGLVPVDGGWTLPLTAADGGTCVGLQCQIPTCSGGTTTAITGTVWDPAAINPVYNAVVMIPNGPVQPIPAGVSNDPCGGANLPPAVTYAYSDTSGHFTLSNVPVGASIPLVIQLGRWRRVTTIDTSALTCKPVSQATNISVASGCGDPTPGLNKYAGTAGCATRFPRVQGDGNIPHIAIGTGGLDAIECMLYRMGVSSTEYTDENGTGRINIFNDGGANLAAPNANHDLSYLLGFTCPGAQCPTSTQNTTNIVNSSFEGNINGWTATGTVSDSGAAHHLGADSALVGDSVNTNVGNSTLSQTFTAPAGVTGLSFWAVTHCSQNSNTDWFGATLKDNTSGATTSWWGTHATGCPSTAAWTNFTANGVNPGDSYTLTFETHDVDNHRVYAYVDDVSWLPYLGVVPLLNNYDLVMLPCDGGGEYNSSNWGADYDDPGRSNLINYASVGGRIFTSHWGREWIERTSTALANGPFPNVANWIADGSGGAVTGVIDTSQAYGQTFDTWMQAVGATANTLITINPQREDTSSVVAASSRQFVYYQADGYPADFTFDTPVGSAMPVGRVMYTDMHLANGNPFGTFPTNCPTQGSALLQQEDAAEYLLFDLGACVTGLPIPMGSKQYDPSTFTRDYQAVCPSGFRPRWRWFQWSDTLPKDSNIVFAAYTADTEAQLGTEFTPPLPVTLFTSTAGNPGPVNPLGPPRITVWTWIQRWSRGVLRRGTHLGHRPANRRRMLGCG